MSSPRSGRTPISSPAVWRADDVADPASWTIELAEAERAELVAFARSAHGAGATIATVTLAGAQLPAVGELLARAGAAVLGGRGFVRLRGFPIDQLEPAEVELAYVALGLHLGTPVSQDAQGTRLGHVRDERIPRTGPEVRLYRTRERQDFHTDGADIIGLLCLHGARAGGESRLVSGYAIYNEVLRRRPDLLEVLYEPMWWDRNGQEAPGEEPAFPLPIVREVDGTPRFFYIGWYIRDAQRHPQVPRLTGPQREALELIESIANDPRFHVGMDFRPGDVQLLDNATILHSREAYEDHEELDRRRHLLRLWLAARSVPFASTPAPAPGPS